MDQHQRVSTRAPQRLVLQRRVSAAALGAALVIGPAFGMTAQAAEPTPTASVVVETPTAAPVTETPTPEPTETPAAPTVPAPDSTPTPVPSASTPSTPASEAPTMPGEDAEPHAYPFDYILFQTNSTQLDTRWPRIVLTDADGNPVSAPDATIDFIVTANGQSRTASEQVPASALRFGDGDVIQRVMTMTGNPKVWTLSVTITKLEGLPNGATLGSAALPITLQAHDRRKHFHFDDVDVAVHPTPVTPAPTPTPTTPLPSAPTESPSPRPAPVTPTVRPTTKPRPVATPAVPTSVPVTRTPTPHPTPTPTPTTSVQPQPSPSPSLTVREEPPVAHVPEPEPSLWDKILASPATPLSGGAIVTMLVLLSAVPPTGFGRPHP